MNVNYCSCSFDKRTFCLTVHGTFTEGLFTTLPSSLVRHAAQKLKKEQDDGSNEPYKAVLQLHKLSHTDKGRFRTRKWKKDGRTSEMEEVS
ncbi:hypothetical protein Tco_1341654, partial [Tanacetum coccineum]